MLARITGTLESLEDGLALVDVSGLGYQVMVPACSAGELGLLLGEQVTLYTLQFLQLERNRATPMLIGFLRPSDREFFERFTTVAGVGPKLAARALTKPVEEIAAAIDAGDVATLVALPSIGSQKAKQIIAKLQGKLGAFALPPMHSTATSAPAENTLDEARLVLAQLQLTRKESDELLAEALELLGEDATTEALVNEALKHKGRQL